MPRIELLKVVGSQLNNLYALVNVERDVGEFVGQVHAWDGASWKCVYRDDHTFLTDCVMLDDDTLLLAREDGHLVILSASGTQVVPTANAHGGFLLAVASPNEVLLAGSAISSMDIASRAQTTLFKDRTEWSAIAVSPSGVLYVVGSHGRVVRVQQGIVTPIAPSFDTYLLAVNCHDDMLVVGGWHGLVQYQLLTDGVWQDFSLPITAGVTSMLRRGSQLITCAAGVYAYVESTHTWVCEIEAEARVSHLCVIGDTILACHTYTGRLSLWRDHTWVQEHAPLVGTGRRY